MTNDELGDMLKDTHNMTVRMHEALIVAKVPERLSKLEQERFEARGAGRIVSWLGGIIGGAAAGWVVGKLGGSK